MKLICVRRFFSGVFLCASLLALASCNKSPSPEEIARLAAERDAAAREQAVADYAAALSDAEKISQLFLVNVERNDHFVPVERTGALYGKRREGEALVPGGCLLFSYNIGSTPEVLASYTASIRKWYADNGHVPPYIAIDQEGGDVNRLRRIASTLVSQKKTAEWFTPEQAYAVYAAQAKQLRLLGIQMNLAPVVEVETESNTAFLDTRTFGSLEQVLSYGRAEVTAFEENGIAAVLKHFPGNSNTDPHTGLPHIQISAFERDSFFKPFEELLPQASAVLISHAIVEEEAAAENDESGAVVGAAASDAVPACFSSYWVKAMVRDAFGFDGLIFSDDIFMGALAGNGYPPDVAAVAVIEAGIDCIMLSEKQFGSVAGVLLKKASEDEAFAAKIDAAVRRVIKYKIKSGLLSLVQVTPEGAASGTGGEVGPGDVEGSGGGNTETYYEVRAVTDFDDSVFDSAAFAEAYGAGMEFYK
ncbi:MAG: glycoside hydrolase family 3 protein [Treponema sp.]|nr:glycoside hydrolase family 3 protein [Treponema sp.]